MVMNIFQKIIKIESERIDTHWLITYYILFNKIKIKKDIKWVIFPSVHYDCRCIVNYDQKIEK